MRAFERKGVELKIVRQRAEKLRKYLVVGLKCRCKWTDGNVYDAVIQKVLEGDRYLVLYPEYGNEDEASIVDFDAESVKKEDKRDRSPSQDKPDRRSHSRDGRDGHSRSRDRERKKRTRRHSDSDSSPERRSKERSRSRERGSRDRERSSRDRDRRRSRSRESKRELTLDEEVEALLKKKRESEKFKATTGDGKYCAQIVSYKKLLSKQFRGGETFDTTNRKLDLPDAHPRPSEDRRRDSYRRRSRSPSPIKKKELTHEQKMKQAELLARYGDASHTKKKA